MFKPRFAICVDGGFVQKVLRQRTGHFPTASEVLAECQRIAEHSAVEGCDLLRIYYYDAPPAQGVMTNPMDASQLDLQATELCRAAMSLHADLRSAPNVALRMGEVLVNGWRVSEYAIDRLAKAAGPLAPRDLRPNLKQKGVDIRIGLDIARLALNDTVRSLVVVTADTDFVPAFKFARREGIRVFLDTLGCQVRPELIEHSDLRLSDIPTAEERRRERQRRQRANAKAKRVAEAAIQNATDLEPADTEPS